MSPPATDETSASRAGRRKPHSLFRKRTYATTRNTRPLLGEATSLRSPGSGHPSRRLPALLELLARQSTLGTSEIVRQSREIRPHLAKVSQKRPHWILSTTGTQVLI